MKNIKIIVFLLCLLFTKSYYSSTYIVTTTADATSILYPVVGSLRWAIEQVNSNPGADVITFNISGTLPLTITLNYALPIITGPVTIDGNTQPGTYLTGKKIIINAANNDYGLNFFNGNNSTISNLEIKNYKMVGIYLDYVNTSTLSENIINSPNQPNSLVLQWGHGNNNIIKANIFGTDYSLSTNPIYNNGGIDVGVNVLFFNGTEFTDNFFGGSSSSDGNKVYNVKRSFSNYFTPTIYYPLAFFIRCGKKNKSSNNQFINCGGGAFNYLATTYWSNAHNAKPAPSGITATPSGPNFIIQGNTAPGDIVEIYKSNPYSDIMQLLGATTANGAGVFNTSITGVAATDRIAVAGTFTDNTTSEFAWAYLNSNPPCCSSMALTQAGLTNYTYVPGYYSAEGCINTSLSFSTTGCSGGLTYNWLFDDTYPSSSTTGQNITKLLATQATYPSTINISCLATGSGCNPSLTNVKATMYDCSCNTASIGVGTGNCFNMGEYIPFSVVGCTNPGLTYNWSFGDGYFGTGLYPNKSYIAAGTYSIGVIITGTAIPVPIVLSSSVIVTQNACPYACTCSVSALGITNPKPEYCIGEPISFDFIGTQCNSSSSLNALINMGDCTPTVVSASGFLDGIQHNLIYSYSAAGTYNVSIMEEGGCIQGSVSVTVVDCVNEEGDISNPKCQPAFAPTPGDYVLSFWIREDNIDVISYISGIEIFIYTNNTFYGSTTAYANGSFNAANKIIDGWQKVEKIINIPNGVSSIDIKLKNLNSTSVFPLKNTYFDDIRFHPVNSGFKSYVYDPVSLRLVAELDDRNYATFYEYDEEGQLIRVKKETDRGIKTIKENRTSVKKK